MQAKALRHFPSGGQALPVDAAPWAPHPRTNAFLFQDAWWMLFCIFLMCEGIPVVSTLRLVSLTAGVGLVLMAAQITQRDALHLVLFALLNASILLSVIAGGRLEIVIFACARVYVICPYVYLYLTHRGLGRPTAVALALGMLPQLFVYLTEITFSTFSAYAGWMHQFCGISGDPNYVCTYLVVALGAQLALIRCSRSIPLCVPWILAAATTLFLVTITLSRAGTAAVFLALLIFGLSFRVRHPLVRLAVVVFMIYAFFATAQHVAEEFFPDASVGALYRRFSTEGKTSILENERYNVWKSAFDQAIAKGPIDYVDESMFRAQEGTFVHNVLLRLALTYGWLTALVHVVIWGAGLAALSLSFYRELFSKKRQQLQTLSSPSSVFLILLPYFLVVMTIPALDQNLYWYEFGMVFTLGLFKPCIPQEQV